MGTIISFSVILSFFAYTHCYLRIADKKIAKKKYREIKNSNPELSHRNIKSLVIEYINELNSGSNTDRNINEW